MRLSVLLTVLMVMLGLAGHSAHAGPGREAWHHADAQGRALLLQAYQQFFLAHEGQESYGEFQGKKAAAFFQFISEAWASDPSSFDCFYAGWPSKRNGTCSSPSRSNPDYQQGSCQASEMHCQPLLFGEGLCVSVATKAQRQVAFSQCEKRYKDAGRTVASVVAEVRGKDKEAMLLALLDKADAVCTQGAQASTGMCRRLEAIVAGVRQYLGSPEGRAVVTSTSLLGALSRDTTQVATRSLASVAATADTCLRDVPITISSVPDLVVSSNVQISIGDLVEVPTVIEATEEDAAEEPVQDTATVVADASAASVAVAATTAAPAANLMKPSEFLASASGPLTYVARGKISDVENSCMLENNDVIVLYLPCASDGNGKVQARIIGKAGGMMDVVINNKKRASVADLTRAEYDGTFMLSYTPTGPVGTASIASVNGAIASVDAANFCFVGMAVSDSRSQCSGTVPHGTTWLAEARTYWQNPGNEFFEFLRQTNTNVAKN